MKTFHTRRTVRHSPDDMYALVADVERYPDFVPLCERLRVRERITNEAGETTRLVADMTVSFKLFRETFTSAVDFVPAERRIVARYLDGPFRNMENRWVFRELGGGPQAPNQPPRCDVEFYLAYELQSRALQLVVGAVFDRAFAKFAEAFEQRADTIYAGAT